MCLKLYSIKRIISCILILTLFTFILCSCELQGETESSLSSQTSSADDYAYTVSEDKASITSYKGAGGDVTIPERLDGYIVNEIADNAFSYCEMITSVSFPDSLEKIGYKAFYGCSSLSEIVFPRKLNYVGGFAFAKTAWLNSQSGDFVVAGDGVLVAYIGKEYKITVPEGVKSIAGAFYNNYTLTDITLPSTIERIESNAFYTCTLIKSITVEASNAYKTENNTLYTADGKTLIYRAPQSSGESFEIPAGVEKIGEYAFANNTKLKFLTLPAGLKSIGAYAFDYCTMLSEIMMPDSVQLIGRYAFSSCENLKAVTLSEKLEKIPEGAFSDCISIEHISIPQSVRQVENKAFYYCTSLKKVDLPGTTSVAENAFEGCSAL